MFDIEKHFFCPRLFGVRVASRSTGVADGPLGTTHVLLFARKPRYRARYATHSLLLLCEKKEKVINFRPPHLGWNET